MINRRPQRAGASRYRDTVASLPAGAPEPGRGQAEPEQAPSLRDYLGVVRRRHRVIIAMLVLVPAAAVLLAIRQDRVYSAHAQVLLGRQNLANALTGTADPSVYLQADRVALTQADLARVPSVAAQAIATAGARRSAAELLAHSSIAPKPNTDILEFTVRDREPAVAISLATAYGKAYVAYRQQLDTASLVRARAEVKQRLTELGGVHDALYRSLVEKDQQLATMEALQTANALLVAPASVAQQVQPRPLRNGALAAVLGLALGIGLAFLWEALDTRVRTAEEIAELLGLPLLARLPDPGRRLREENRLVMLEDVHSSAAEAFRMLRTNLDLAQLGHDVRTIMVTSAVEREGKSTTAANLAVAFAHSGRKVALLDLDLRRPSLHGFFELEGPRKGLTHVVLGQASLSEALVPVSVHGLPARPLGDISATTPWTSRQPRPTRAGSVRLLPAGPVPPNPGELAGSPVIAQMIEELRPRFDLVLIDTPPTLQVGDAMALSRSVDAVLLVTRASVIRKPLLVELRRLIDQCAALPLGFALTGADPDDGHGYGYYSGRHDEPWLESAAS